MRLLIGFVSVSVVLLFMQSAHPECSMTDMTGVEWLDCVTSFKLPISYRSLGSLSAKSQPTD